MRTCALVGIDGSIDFLCWPEFDSPSIFCRLLDKDKGGYFTISPKDDSSYTTKQSYVPSTNILQTRFISEDGVVELIDFFPRPRTSRGLTRETQHASFHEAVKVQDALKKWLVRRVECIRGKMDIQIEIFPALDYARKSHQTKILLPKHVHSELPQESKTVVFLADDLKLQLDVITDSEGEDPSTFPEICFERSKLPRMLGEGVVMSCCLLEGQAISLVLRDYESDEAMLHLNSSIIDKVQDDTQTFWFNWISKSKYKGRWREVVSRSLMILKLLTFEPTGAIVAAPVRTPLVSCGFVHTDLSRPSPYQKISEG